jgi:4-amino-4-deoxy-L-arabinose transferase-like glycosyltransferase
MLCGLLILCLAASFGLLTLKTLDSHECFVSVTAREMVERDNWVFPTMNGQPRLNKTPLQYWLVASVSFITGQVDAFTARFPSAVLGFLSALCIFLYVKKWLGFRASLICAAVWITTMCFTRFSRNARPEMGLAFFVLVCYLTFWDAIHSSTRKNQLIAMFIFWISLSLGMLQKGPAPMAYVFVPLFVYFVGVSISNRKSLILWMIVFWICLGTAVLENNIIVRAIVAIPLLSLVGLVAYRRWKTIMKLLPMIGPVLFLLILLPWPLFIGHRIHWDLGVWQREYVDRLSGDYDKGNYPIYFYFLMMFKFLTPWVAFIPMALMSPFYRIWKNKQPLMIYLWVCFVATFIFLTIDQGKRQHYILPVMPVMAILIGILLEDMIFQRKAFSGKFASEVLRYHAIFMGGGAIVGTGVVLFMFPAFGLRTAILSVFALFLIGVVVRLLRRRQPAFATSLIFVGIIVFSLLSRGFFMQDFDEDLDARDFALEIKKRVPASESLSAYRHVSSRFVQYYGKMVPVVDDEKTFKETYENGGWVYCDLSNIIQNINSFSIVYSETEVPGRIRKGDYGGVLLHRENMEPKAN